MICHILNGDVLADQLKSVPLEGDILIMREMMMEGPASGPNLLSQRSKFFELEYQISNELYFEKAKNHIDKIMDLSKYHEINLWFEYDLFCQINCWFIIHQNHPIQLDQKYYLVAPTHNEWTGFGSMDTDQLTFALSEKINLQKEDLDQINNLFDAYLAKNEKQLSLASESIIEKIPNLRHAILAELDRLSLDRNPKKCLNKLMEENEGLAFGKLFRKFCEQHGRFGMGDMQVEKLFKELQNQ